MKRAFDFLASLIGLLFLMPFFCAVAVAIKLDSRGPVFFRGERVGKEGKLFRILKFRTMVTDAAARGALTHRDDPRVTRVGRFLRRTKIDELPQLINVLRGEMSLVGPRPEDPRYLPHYSARQRRVLAVPPGMTSIASVRYRHEGELLPPEDWEKTYVETILPAKLDIELTYLATRSFGQDMIILLASLLAMLNIDAQLEAWSRVVLRVEEFAGRYLSWMGVDALLIVLAYVLALLVRSITARIDFPTAFLEALVGVAIYIVVNYRFGIYHRFWRYASASEAVALFGSTFVATTVVSLLDLLMQERDLPLGAVWLGGFFTFFLLTAVRYRWRLLTGLQWVFAGLVGFASSHGARVLIVGAGDEGQLLAWQMQNRAQGQAYQVVGFIDADRRKHGMRIHNVMVYGDRDKIPEVCAKLHPDIIIIAIPPARVQDPRGLLKLCRSTQAQIKILPSLFEWLRQSDRAPGWEDVTDDELLQRPLYHVDEEACRKLLTDRVVLVTGAAGSIGSELCRQIAAYRPRQLVLVDINESGLHDLGVELRARDATAHFALALCDITNSNSIESVFGQFKPQVVFHAAAYKHVPMLEQHPAEAVRVNVLGTRLVHALADQFGVERFILISTDKAANPSSVLGMTKWIGELMVTLPARAAMLSAAVRFGNVLGSRGSVVATFEKQIELGSPLTITHPEMTRYFLSLGEAISLVIQAAAMTRGGEIYILDMGVPVRIVDLAARVIRAHGLRPDQDVAIEFVGPRPGEKLNEELVGQGEEKAPTEHRSIFRIRRSNPIHLEQLQHHVDALLHLSANGTAPDQVRAKLQDCVHAINDSRD